MSNFMLSHLLFRHQRPIIVTSQRYQRTPFAKPKRSFEDRNRMILNAHNNSKLKLAEATTQPDQWKLAERPKEPKILTNERKLPSLVDSALPYEKYTKEDIESVENFETYYDPLFNPHLHERKNEVNPEEEPFNAIYADNKSKTSEDYTKVRNITTPELWHYVERLARIRIAPETPTRKAGEPLIPLPSGFMPRPETPPDLPYFIPRTRNSLLPVYYRLDSDPEQCVTYVKQVTGDLWQLEENLRTHLESIHDSKGRILTSVQETDGLIQFRGRHIHQIVDWLHKKGF